MFTQVMKSCFFLNLNCYKSINLTSKIVIFQRFLMFEKSIKKHFILKILVVKKSPSLKVKWLYIY